MTLFPEMIESGLGTSITGRAIKQGIISLNPVNIRDFSNDKHGHVDDYPYGGGAGMVMAPQPVYDCYKAIMESIQKDCPNNKPPRVIYMTPQGKVFNQDIAAKLAKEDDLIFLCGHYEGIDERVLEKIVTDEVSIGDYVLTGGELPAMVMMDTISRLVPGVLNNNDSAAFDSFQDGLLEHPQYTRPEVFDGHQVPAVLLSGNHVKINQWRHNESLKRTWIRRPDLLEDMILHKEDRKILAYIQDEIATEEDFCKNSLEQWLSRLDENEVINDIDLGQVLCRMFVKDAKKAVKKILKHMNQNSCIKVEILPYITEKEQLKDLLDRDTYFIHGRIYRNMPLEFWVNRLSQWFHVSEDKNIHGHNILFLTKKS